MYRTYVHELCFYMYCIHVREDSVLGSPFNGNWSRRFVLTFVIASCFGFFFSVCFCFLVLFVCVVFKVQHLRRPI